MRRWLQHTLENKTWLFVFCSKRLNHPLLAACWKGVHLPGLGLWQSNHMEAQTSAFCCLPINLQSPSVDLVFLNSLRTREIGLLWSNHATSSTVLQWPHRSWLDCACVQNNGCIKIIILPNELHFWVKFGAPIHTKNGLRKPDQYKDLMYLGIFKDATCGQFIAGELPRLCKQSEHGLESTKS